MTLASKSLSYMWFKTNILFCTFGNKSDETVKTKIQIYQEIVKRIRFLICIDALIVCRWKQLLMRSGGKFNLMHFRNNNKRFLIELVQLESIDQEINSKTLLDDGKYYLSYHIIWWFKRAIKIIVISFVSNPSYMCSAKLKFFIKSF